MTTNEYLSQIHHLNSHIDKLILKKSALMSSLTGSGIDYSRTPVQTSPKDKMSATYADIDEIERDITACIDRLADMRSLITQQINGLTGFRATVLYRYYVELQSWGYIAYETKKTKNYLHKVRKDGLKEFYRLYRNKIPNLTE